MGPLSEPLARCPRLEVRRENLGAGSFRLIGRDSEPLAGNESELLGLEEVYFSFFEYLDYTGRKVNEPQIVIHEAC